MNIFAPPKLRQGDHIRIISPSSSVARIGGFHANLSAKVRLERMGYTVSFSDNYLANDEFGSASIAERVDDLHKAFADPNVKAILATIGGFNSNELLPYLDYEFIKANPKIICGYSDTTAVLTAIFAKTGMITYMGASYSSFKMDELQDYQSAMWTQALTQSQYELIPSDKWSSDLWFLPDCTRQFFDTRWQVYTEGRASGRLIGGNLSTFCLLNGTPYAPKVDTLGDYVIMLEMAEGYDIMDFARQLTAVLQTYLDPKAVLFGRVPTDVGMTDGLLRAIFDKHPILGRVPVMYDMDFAHTQPLFTVGIGSNVVVDTQQKLIKVFE